MKRVAAGLGIACLAGVSSPALAAEPPVVGWWYEAQQVPAAVPADLPAPPYVPAGDLLVEGSTTGPDAVAALRFLLPQGQDAGTLTVPVVSTRGTAALEVCATLSGWAPAEVGDWGMRPVCGPGTKAVPMVLSKDGTSLSAPVRSLAKDGVVDVLLEPGVDPTTGAQLATSVTLAPKATLTTTPSAVAPPPVQQTPEPVTPEPATAAAPPPVLAPPVAGPVLPGVQPPAAAPSAVPAQPTPQVALPAAPQALPKAVRASATKGRSEALLLLLLTGLAGALLSRRPGQGSELGGVGRYRTERTGAPAVRL